jgi:hypothetical protein
MTFFQIQTYCNSRSFLLSILFPILLPVFFCAVLLTACSQENQNSSTLDEVNSAQLDMTNTSVTESPADVLLQFDSSTVPSESFSVTLDESTTVDITKYTVTYVASPLEGAEMNGDNPFGYQSMAIYVSADAASDQNAAIILSVNNGGWLRSELDWGFQGYSPGMQAGDNFDSINDKIGAVLSRGYVYVDVGTRSRGAIGADGSFIGKAPAVVVDAKAAIRYLRLNDAVLPGDSEKIVITGTSGGGGLSTAVAASGNSPDFYSDLLAIGAAGFDTEGRSTLNDDVFAVIAYCPITDLGNADIAYEWQYNNLRTVGDSLAGPGGGRPWAIPNLSQDMLEASDQLKQQYPDYLASLGLSFEDGTELTVDTMPDAITGYAKASVEAALAAGKTVPDLGEAWDTTSWPSRAEAAVNDWFDIAEDGATVTVTSYENFLAYVKATANLKGAPSFDVSGTSEMGSNTASGESNLFGAEDQDYSNFMQWAWNNNNVENDDSGLDDTGMTWEQFINDSELAQQIRLINPIAYLTESENGDSAPHWYVRHGLRDRDTSFAVEMELFFAIMNDPAVSSANTALAYDTGHSGDYDVEEAYQWLDTVIESDSE